MLAVQNAVDFSILGAATSGVTLARGIGGSLGTALFGTIFSTQLRSHLRGALTRSAGEPGRGRRAAHGSAGAAAAAGRAHRPTSTRTCTRCAPCSTWRPGVAAFGFVLSLLLPERPLRDSAATSTGLEDGLAAPRSPDSLAEIERALTKVTTRDERMRFRERIAERAGVEISPGAIWALVRIDEHGAAQARAMAEQDGVDPARIAAVVDELRAAGPDRRRGRRRPSSPRPGVSRPSASSPRGASC